MRATRLTDRGSIAMTMTTSSACSRTSAWPSTLRTPASRRSFAPAVNGACSGISMPASRLALRSAI